MIRLPQRSTLLPYTTLFRSQDVVDVRARELRRAETDGGVGLRIRVDEQRRGARLGDAGRDVHGRGRLDWKSTRLNSSHANISYTVFCLKKNKHQTKPDTHTR